MHILQAIEFFTPSMGGSVQVAYQISRHLARLGHKVTVCTSDFQRNAGVFPDQPFQVHYFHSLSTRWNFFVTPSLIPWAWKHVGEFDIIHLHNVRTFQNAVVGAIARRKGIPYVISAHGSLPYLASRSGIKRGFDVLFGKRLVGGARQMLAVSEAEVRQFSQAGVPSEKIRLVSNGLDLEEFSNLPRQGTFRCSYQIPAEAMVIFFLGRIHPIKGLDHLIAAYSGLSSNLDNVWLVIAGPDDGDLERLRGLVYQIPTGERVLFPGPLYGADKLAALVDADVLAFPSSYEIFGLVPFEALLCGTPVVASRESIAGQMIERVGAGYTAPFGAVDAWQANLYQALTQPATSAEMVLRGQAFIRENLDWEEITDRLLHVYEGG